MKHFCKCGCGTEIIWRPEYNHKGWALYKKHHHLPGRKLSTEHKQNVSLAKMGSKNAIWKGDRVGYAALHAWVKRHLVKSEKCQKCNKKKPYDLANISQKYKRDLSDWEWLCRKCHMQKDGRMFNLKQYRIWKEELTINQVERR